MTFLARTLVHLLILSLACIGLSAAASGETVTRLNRGNVAEPDTLDPHKMTTLYEGYIGRDIYHSLVVSDNKGEIVGGTAETWEVSEDGLTYIFHLRPDLKWSDGHAFSAEDVVAGFQRLLNPATASQSASLVFMIKNAEEVATGKLPVEDLAVEALDPQTVKITLLHPAPSFLGIIAGSRGAPLPRHAYEKYGDDWALQQNFVGNGPFKFVEWQPNNFIRAVKNPYFYDADNVKLEEIYYYPTEDYNAAIKRYRAGELDWNAQVPTQQVPLIEDNFPDDLKISLSLSVTYIWINHQVKPFDDPRVREAMTLAIDRRIITEKIMKMGEQPAYSLVPPFVTDYKGPQFAFNDEDMKAQKARAIELLAEAGYGPDNPLEFEYRIRATADGKRHAAAIQSFWKAVGIKANILATDIKTHYNDLSEHNFAVADAGWSALNDPEDFLYLCLTSSGPQNSGNYSNPEYDRLMAEAKQMANTEERFATMAAAEKILLDDYGIIPLFFMTDRHLVKPYVKGFYPNVIDVHPSQYITIEK